MALRMIFNRSRIDMTVTALFLLSHLPAGVASAQAAANETHTGTTTIHTGTRLVVVDVIVRGRDGQPIRGLKQQDFELLENKSPQALRHFEEHTSATKPASAPALPQLPPGTYMDYTALPVGGPLNILLFDALNTPMSDQAYVRQQLQQYIKHATPGTRVAIFGLANRLFLLQGFTSDPGILKAAIDRKLIPNTSTLLDDPSGSNADPTSLSEAISDAPPTPPRQTSSIAQIAASLRQFEESDKAAQAQLRTQYTLDAFDQLGHYLANFPGRKNLIWFSGSFPLNIFPDSTIAGGSSSQQNNTDEFHEAIDLLARAQVAVYPVDARGLMTNPMYSSARSGRGYGKNPASVSTDIAKFNQSQAAEHTTMDQLADETGGHAYYNTNGLSEAVANALESGANYYTLMYTPADHETHGEYRRLHVSLVGGAAAGQATLSYRQGYFADDPDRTPAPLQASASSQPSENRAARTYAMTSMSLGAPAPEDILFKLRVLPASASTEDTIAAGNSLDAASKARGPFRRFDIDLAAPPSQILLAAQPDGRRTGKIDLTAFVYDSQGQVLNRAGKIVDLNLTAETYKRFMEGAVDMHLEVSAPIKDSAYLRVSLQDIPANRIGVVEIPLADVNKLTPLTQTDPAPSPQ